MNYNIRLYFIDFNYYPGGMEMKGRKYQAGVSSYRYSINGQEVESDLNKNITTALYWEYDCRLGRRLNVDPIMKSDESSFLTFSNNPLIFKDPDGRYSRFGAWWRNMVHCGEGIGEQKNKNHSNGNWYYEKRKDSKIDPRGVYNGITIYSYKHFCSSNSVAAKSNFLKTYSTRVASLAEGFFDKYELVSGGILEVTVGAQAGIEGKVVIGDIPLSGKIEAGYEVHNLVKIDINSMNSVVNNESPFKVETGDPSNPITGDCIIEDYANLEVGVEDKFTLGASYTQSSYYYNSYYNNSKRTGDKFYEWGAFGSKGAGGQTLLKPATSVNAGNRFIGIDFGGSIKAVFGLEIHFKIGIQKK
jgi:hypothetical protein